MNRLNLFVVCFMIITGIASAEIITLNSEKVVEGQIIERTDELIKVDIGVDVPITYYVDEIKDVKKQLSEKKISFSNRELSTEEQEFIDKYIASINGSDWNAYKDLTHPEAIGCINDSTREFYKSAFFEIASKGRMPSEPRVIIASFPIAFLEQFIKIGFSFPIQPTHVIQIYSKGTDPQDNGKKIFISYEDGKVYDVIGCPSTEILDKFLERQKRLK